MTQQYHIIDHAQDACVVVTGEIICELTVAKQAGHGEILYQGAFATTVGRMPFTDLVVNFLKCPANPATGVWLPKLKDYALEVEKMMIQDERWEPVPVFRTCIACWGKLDQEYFIGESPYCLRCAPKMY